LIDAFRAAMKELGVSGRLIATDATDASPAYHRADDGIVVPRVRDKAYMPATLAAVRKHKIGLLVPLTDLDLHALSLAQKKFAASGCTIMIGSPSAIRLCRDKARLNSVLNRAGLPIVRTMRLDDFRCQPFWPCFAKPVSGSAGVGASVIRNQSELDAHVGRYGPEMIVQECLTGQEVTVDVYRSRDGRIISVVPRQRLAIRSGEVEKGITIKDEALIADVVRVAKLLNGMWGVFCIQCRRRPGLAPQFFEINARFGGGAPLAIAAGANLPKYLIQEALGMKLTPAVGEFTDKLLMLRYDDAVFVRHDDPQSLPGFDTPTVR